MYKRSLIIIILMILCGFKIVSKSDLEELKNPPNPLMKNIKQNWQNKLIPQVTNDARPASDLISDINSSKDFDITCDKYGYRTSDENPCVFYVRVVGKILSIDTKSRSGRMTIEDDSGLIVTVQIGPIIRGTSLRDGFKFISYSKFNDQVLYGDYAQEVNKLAVAMIKNVNLIVGHKVEVNGVFATWDKTDLIKDVTPVQIKSLVDGLHHE